jgi:hypothetical protein
MKELPLNQKANGYIAVMENGITQELKQQTLFAIVFRWQYRYFRQESLVAIRAFVLAHTNDNPEYQIGEVT